MDTSQAVACPKGRLAALLAFNFLPAGYMDASWWQDSRLTAPDALHLDKLLANARRNPSLLRRLSGWTLQRLALAGQFDFDFSAEAKQLAFMPNEGLARLAYLVGLCLHSGSITKVILGKDRRQLRESLGEADYSFATRQGPRLLQEAGVAPLPAIQWGAGQAKGADCRQACCQAGVEALALLTAQLPTAFTARLKLKLPAQQVNDWWRPDAMAAEQERVSRLFSLLQQEPKT